MLLGCENDLLHSCICNVVFQHALPGDDAERPWNGTTRTLIAGIWSLSCINKSVLLQTIFHMKRLAAHVTSARLISSMQMHVDHQQLAMLVLKATHTEYKHRRVGSECGNLMVLKHVRLALTLTALATLKGLVSCMDTSVTLVDSSENK